MKNPLVCFAIALVTLSTYAVSSEKMAAGGVEQQIMAAEQKWVAAAKASSPDMVAPLLADNLVNLNSDGTMINKAKTLDNLKKSKWQTNEISDVKVTVSGNTAIATGAWQGKGSDQNGKAVDAHERWVDTWTKTSAGQWQCVATASAPSK